MAKQGRGARNKGSNFERKIADMLSRKIYGEKGKFHRVPMSGGLHWSGNARSCGDIICDNDKFPFVIECKNQEAWDFMQLFNQKGTLWNFIQQSMEESVEADKPWLLVFKKNHSPIYICYSKEMPSLYRARNLMNDYSTITIAHKKGTFYKICLFEDFIDSNLDYIKNIMGVENDKN